MADLIVLTLASFATIVFLGYAVIVHCRQAHRDVLLPAAPVLGVALLVVVLTTTSWFLSAGAGAVVLVLIALASITAAVRRRPRSWTFGPRSILMAGVTWVIGLLGAALAMIPNAQVGDSGVIMGSGNNDALYYTSVAGFLADHSILPLPVIGTSPAQNLTVPAYASALFAFTYPLRIGQSLAHAALTRILGSDVMTTAMPVMALWVLIVPGAVYTSLRLLRVGSAPALGGAAGVGLSALLIFQVANQNMDSLLGAPLAILTIGAVVAAAQNRLPRFPAALVLTALIACYTEYVLFVIPAIGAGVLIYRSHYYLRNVYRAAQVLVISVAIAPTAWYRGAVQVVNFEGSSGDASPSPFFPDHQGAWLNHILGVSPITSDTPVSDATIILAVILVVGCLLAVLVSRNRGVWIGLLVVGLSYIVNLTLNQKGYTQFRSVILIAPLIITAAAAGYGAWLGVLKTRRRMVMRLSLSAGLSLALALWIALNYNTAQDQVDPVFAASRHIGEEYHQAAQWVSEFGGVDGQDITVLAPDFVQNVALNLILRDFDRVSYPVENANYLHVGAFWDGGADPYLLIGAGVQFDVHSSAIVRRNDKFVLIDRRVPGGTVIAPIDLTRWNWFVEPDGSFLGGYGSQFLVIQSDESMQSDETRSSFVQLEVKGADQSVPVELRQEATNLVVRANLGSEPSPVPLPKTTEPSFTVVIDRPIGVADQSNPKIVLSDSQLTVEAG